MNIAAVYIRVSTDSQTEYSPDAQLKAIKEYAKKHDIQIDPRYIFKDEGISGRKAEKRPAFMEMIRTAKSKPSPFNKILVHKFDRFARNREDSIVYKSLLKK
jgi:DNA invertase Pin-like site-specific DNA recombinase